MSNVFNLAKVSKNTGITYIQDKRMKKLVNQGWHFKEVMDRVDWLVMERKDELVFISPRDFKKSKTYTQITVSV